jgi:hypothetical protein
MNRIRTKLAAVALMGFAAVGLSTATAVADEQPARTSTTPADEIGDLPNLNGYCQAYGWDYSMPLDTGDAYSWVCASNDGFATYIAMDNACRWHHPAFPNAVAAPLNEGDAYSWRCYA